MTKQHPKSEGERGYMLLAIMLLVNLMVIGLMLEAPRIAQEIKREKEEELIHRANEYKVAIRKYFRKFGQYPVSIEQLENTNNMRFLRKRYKDPFTGKDDWRLLHPGDVQVNALNGATGAPGQPMGSAIGQPMGSSFGQTAGNTFGQQPGNSFGQQPGGAFGQQPGGAFGQQPGSTFGQPSGLNGNPSTPAGAQPGSDQSASGAAPGATTAGITPVSNMPGASSNSPVIGGGPVIGVASISKLKSIKEIDGKDHYNDWQFVYDPRLDVQTMTPGGAGAPINPIGASTTNPGMNPGPGFGANPSPGFGSNPTTGSGAGQQGPPTTPPPMSPP